MKNHLPSSAENTFRLKTKSLYIIRHGQTDYNLQQKVQGRGIDSSLNDTGRQQAEAFFRAYRHIPFDKIYTSSLQRTTQSVAGFLELGIPSEARSGLDEINWGKHEGQCFDHDMGQAYAKTIAAWSSGDIACRIEGGESLLQLAKRQKKAIKNIMAQSDEEEILIATHGRAIRTLVCWLLNYPLKCVEAFEHHNLCLYHLAYAQGVYSVLKHADITHLQ